LPHVFGRPDRHEQKVIEKSEKQSYKDTLQQLQVERVDGRMLDAVDGFKDTFWSYGFEEVVGLKSLAKILVLRLKG